MKIIMYSKNECPNCNIAENILKARGVDSEIRKVDENPEYKDEYVNRVTQLTGSAPRSVPGIFAIDNNRTTYIGSHRELTPFFGAA